MLKIVCFILCDFYHNKNSFNKKIYICWWKAKKSRFPNRSSTRWNRENYPEEYLLVSNWKTVWVISKVCWPEYTPVYSHKILCFTSSFPLPLPCLPNFSLASLLSVESNLFWVFFFFLWFLSNKNFYSSLNGLFTILGREFGKHSGFWKI